MGELGITAVYVTHDRVEALALSDTIAVMHAGRVVEQGTPQRIYFDAEHRFVADFIGRANLVPATVRARANGATLVDCALGRLACEPSSAAPGTELTLCIRPEFIHVGAKPTPSSNVISGHVASLTFVGEVYEAEIRVGDTLLLARLAPDVRLAQGDPVRCAVDPAHCRLVVA
jgi:iron(III) transport system ATP-binding protein